MHVGNPYPSLQKQPYSKQNDSKSGKSRLTFECLALNQIEVVRLFEDSALESAAKALQVAAINVEHGPQHGSTLKFGPLVEKIGKMCCVSPKSMNPSSLGVSII
jgi:hypothetical protein